MRVYGVAGAAATSITTQLAQAFSSGQLAGDELKSLSENAAGLYVALEKAVQEILKSKSTLKELGSQGKVTSDVIYQAFKQAFSGIRGEMESMPATLEQQKARMENAWQSLLSAIDEKVHQSDAWKWITGKLSSAFTFAAIDLGNLDVPTEDLKNALEALERRIKELAEIGGVIEKELSPALQDAAKAIQDALKAREEEKEGATGGNKPGGATTVGPSDSFKKALDKRAEYTRTALQIERQIWDAYSRERSAKTQEDAQKAQQAQEDAFAALAKSGASKTLIDYYAGLVGQLGEQPIKTKMVVQLDEQSFLALDDRMEQILNGKEYDVTLKAKVQPELIWTDADTARANVAAREAAQTGSVGEQ
jgi:tape measure domain-containing protein